MNLINYFCCCGLKCASGVTSENCLTFFSSFFFFLGCSNFIAVPKRKDSLSQVTNSGGGRYVFKIINKFNDVIMKVFLFSPNPPPPKLTSTSVFLIWCQENLVTANTMFSKADLASEGGKLSRAASALFPW